MRPKLLPEIEKIANWLRFENRAPASQAEIEAATGVKMTPQIIAQADFWGIVRYSAEHGGYI